MEKNFLFIIIEKKPQGFVGLPAGGVYVGKQRVKNAKPIKWSGYMFIKKPGHYRANKQGYVKIADLVAEKKIGRRLKKDEIVHHIDHNKINDNEENLTVMTSSDHSKLHKSASLGGRWSRKHESCQKCGTRKYSHQAKGHCSYCYKKFIERKK